MRAGTTFLHHALSAHPLIVTPSVKETQFFSLRWPEGEVAYRRQLPWRPPEWAYAATGKRRPLAIDSSPYYLFHPQAPSRVRQLLGPSIKAIVLLREPGERAWSHYRLSLARGQEHLGFLDAIAWEDERLAGETERLAAGREAQDAPHQILSYIARGRYAEQLQHWWAHIPRGQFLLLRSEDLFRDPQKTFDRVCRFLDLPTVGLPADLPVNAAPHSPLPPRAREELDRIYEAPNRALFDLTGIEFGRTGVSREANPSPHGYMAAYRAHTDARVLNDPYAAVGGLWEEIGRLQFQYLVNEGLRPGHTVLDIGCGTLRGGRHFIAYLEPGKYTGLDISPNALAHSARLVEREGLSRKRPALLLDGDMKPGFEEFDSKFDFLLAQSVFTHLPEAQVEEFFAHAGRVMHAGSKFYFTFFSSPAPSQSGRENFSYPFGFFEALADRYGFAIELRGNYAHPRGQRMAVLCLRGKAVVG